MQQFQVHRLIIVIIGYKKEGIIHLRYAPERCCERFAPGCRPAPPLRPFLPRPEATRQPIDSDWGKFWLVVVSSFGFSFFSLRAAGVTALDRDCYSTVRILYLDSKCVYITALLFSFLTSWGRNCPFSCRSLAGVQPNTHKIDTR